jgi:hypothetical protein
VKLFLNDLLEVWRLWPVAVLLLGVVCAVVLIVDCARSKS